MTKLFNNKYLLIGVMFVLAAVLVLTFCVRSKTAVSADYIEDIVNNPDAIVNFNQLYSNNYINDTFTANSYKVLNSVSFPIINGHSYYVYITNYRSAVYNYKIWGNSLNTSVVDANNQLNIIFVAQNTFNDCKFEVVTSQGGNNRFYINVIDLSAMFGQNNLPSLAQCKEIFKSDYYAYNTGTPVKFNSLDSYAQGFNDALASQEYVFNEDMVRSMIFLNIGDSLWGSTTNQNIGVEVNSNNVGSLGINLPSPLSIGDTITISDTRLSVITPVAVGSTAWRPDMYVGYYKDGGFISLGQFTMTYNNNPDMSYSGSYEQFFKDVSITITLPVNIDTLYINCNYDFFFWYPQIKASTINQAYAIDNSYKNGFSKAQTQYQNELSKYQGSNGQGGSAYMDIWNAAYNSGLNAQVSNARKKTYTFSAFLGALFDVPVQTINSLLDFNVLGFNMRNFALSIITISIVFAVVRFIMVKRSS